MNSVEAEAAEHVANHPSLVLAGYKIPPGMLDFLVSKLSLKTPSTASAFSFVKTLADQYGLDMQTAMKLFRGLLEQYLHQQS